MTLLSRMCQSVRFLWTQRWSGNVVAVLLSALTLHAPVTLAQPALPSVLGSNVTQIAAGLAHSCALTTAGAVQCWGNNANGQLGNNSNTNSSTPVAVSSLGSGVAAISAGQFHS